MGNASVSFTIDGSCHKNDLVFEFSLKQRPSCADRLTQLQHRYSGNLMGAQSFWSAASVSEGRLVEVASSMFSRNSQATQPLSLYSSETSELSDFVIRV